MKKNEKEFLDALEERFYKVGSFIDGRVFDPYVYKNEKGEVVEAIKLTLNEAHNLVQIARSTHPNQYFHIFNDKDRWISENGMKHKTKSFWKLIYD